MKPVARWIIDNLKSLTKDDEPCFFDKTNAACMVSESYAYFRTGEKEHARELLDEAKRLADFFDSAPREHMNIVKLFELSDQTSAYTLLGRTGKETISTVIGLIGSKKFTAFAK